MRMLHLDFAEEPTAPLSTSLLIALLLLLPFACSRKEDNSELVARAGECRITRQDLTYRQEVLKITEEGRTIDLGIVLTHLLKPCVGAVIMKKYGRPVTTELLRAESKRIDDSTLMPDILKRVRIVFGDNESAYLQDYVLPVYVNRELPYEVVRWNRDIQAASRVRATAWLELVRKQADRFLDMAKTETGQDPGWVEVTPDGGWEFLDPGDQKRRRQPTQPPTGDLPPDVSVKLHMDEKKQKEDSQEWVRKLVDQHLSGVKPRTVVPEVIEFPETFLVLYYAERQGDTFVIRTAPFKKRDYDEFFWDEARKIPVNVSDRDLLDRMVALVPWSKQFAIP